MVKGKEINRIEEMRKQLTTLLAELNLNDTEIRVFQEHQDSLKAVDEDFKAIEQQKTQDKHRAAMYKEISGLYREYKQGYPVFYEIIYQILLDNKVFLVECTKEENLELFDTLVSTKQFVSKTDREKESYLEFLKEARDYCIQRLDELEAEAVILLDLGIKTALAMQEGVRDEIK